MCGTSEHKAQDCTPSSPLTMDASDSINGVLIGEQQGDVVFLCGVNGVPTSLSDDIYNKG
jgi:hypothetical protein